MSNITGRIFGEGFGLRVVSGMLRQGNLVISWATGEAATGRLDYGFDSSIPHQTPPDYLQPGDPGYVPGQNTPLRGRYHERSFPTTYIDTEHFFRVRATNRAGRTLVSAIYSVYVPEKMVIQSQVGQLAVAFSLISPTLHSLTVASPSAAIDKASVTPDASDTLSITPSATIQAVTRVEAPGDQATAIGTTPTLTVDD